MDPDVDPGRFRYSNVALDLSSGRLLSLHGADEETVAAMKARCRALEVRCPVEDCEAPELSATVGYVRRDGTPVTAYFSHKAGGGDGGHGPASYARAQIKHAVRDWAIGLGFDATVDAWIQGAEGMIIDVAIDGPSNFALQVQRSSLAAGEWSAHNRAVLDAGLEPLWLWVAPGGGCPAVFDPGRVTHRHDGLDDLWLAGVDGDGQVRLAVAAGADSGADHTPTNWRPQWRALAEIGLDGHGFVDPSLGKSMVAGIDGERRADRLITGPPGTVGGQPRGDPQLFVDDWEPDLDRLGWSPEERATPGTRWFRRILHDRRHQAFLDGQEDLCAYDGGSPGGAAPP